MPSYSNYVLGSDLLPIDTKIEKLCCSGQSSSFKVLMGVRSFKDNIVSVKPKTPESKRK